MSLSTTRTSPKSLTDLFSLDEHISPLHDAVITHDLSHLRQLVSSNSYDINVIDEYGRTPLIYSIFVGSFGCFEVLLHSGANINLLDYQNKSALHWACQLGQLRIAKYLLNKDSDVYQKDADGRTALHHSTLHHSTKLLILLLKKGLDSKIDQPDSLGLSALHWSAYHNNPESCRILIRNASNPSNVDMEGRTPIHLCASNDSIATIKMLIELSGLTLLTFQDSQGCTLLHHMAAIQNVPLMNSITDPKNSSWLTNLNLNAKDHQHRTPLHWSFAIGSSAISRILITRGAGCYIMDSNGYLPIHYAIERNFVDCIDCYFAFDFTDDLPDGGNRTCLMLSCQLGHVESTRAILQRRPNIVNFSLDHNGMSALHYASLGGNIQCIKILLQYGAQINKQDHLLRTPLSYACENGYFDIVECLFASGSSIKIPAIDGRFPVHYAVLSNSASTLEFLLLQDYQLDLSDQMGRLPFHYACTLNSTTILNMLGFSHINFKDSSGFSPLHWAVMHENMNTIKLLIQNGATLNLLDNSFQRRTPLDLSFCIEAVEISPFLRSMGCVTGSEIQALAVVEIQRFWRKHCKPRHLPNPWSSHLLQLEHAIPSSESLESPQNVSPGDTAIIYKASTSQNFTFPTTYQDSERNVHRVDLFRRKTEAALIIQLFWRRYMRNQQLKNIKSFELSNRTSHKLCEYIHYRKELAALTIQLAWRQFLRRKLLDSKMVKRKKLYQWSPCCLAIRQRLLIEELYSQHSQPFHYTPTIISRIHRPSFIKYIPSPAALSFNFAINQYCRDTHFECSY